jgi:uncharacterized protein YgiM (DUF1202 family)
MREEDMHLRDECAARRAIRASLVAMALCLVPLLPAAQAQDLAPVAGSAVIASAGEEVLLRESPGWDAMVLAPLPDGSALEVIGEPVTAADGTLWAPVAGGGQSGYVPAGYVAGAPVAAPVDVPVAAAEPVVAEAVEPVAAPAPIAEPVAVNPVAGGMATTTDANVRAWPSADAEIVSVLPPNSPVSVNGSAENGFVPVSGDGSSGWVSVELLSEAVPVTSAEPPPLVAGEADPPAAPVANAAPVDAPAATAPEAAGRENRESTGIIWPMAGGEWEVVQGYNNGTHTNRSGFAQYKYSLDWARISGDTAGQPVYAPVSGTIEWTDRGSGGMLIDAGNGYGVALFHVTYDRSVTRGGSVERGQQIGTVSGPGGDGYMSMAHIDITCWRLKGGGGHEAVPFTGPNAIAGQEFPDTGGGNQHMGASVKP